MKKVEKTLHDYGTACMICGERRKRNKKVTPEQLDDWAITEECYDFYSDFPNKEVKDRVCMMCFCLCIIVRRVSVYAQGVIEKH